MQQIISITDARNNLSRLVQEVASQDKTVVIVRDSFPEAAIVPYNQVFKLEAEQEKEREKNFSRVMVKLRKVGMAWAKKKGLNLKKMTEEELYDLVDKI